MTVPGVVVAGVDEAGRGPLAGPVLAAAVVLPPRYVLPGLTDSKALTARRREELECEIKRQALCWNLGRAEPLEIDTLNILQASLLAMARAVRTLSRRPGLVLVDGCHAPPLECAMKMVIKGDVSEPPISAASILAKVARDREMMQLASLYPGYHFESNKGYPTSQHLAALREIGVSAVHRRSFAPVRLELARRTRLQL